MTKIMHSVLFLHAIRRNSMNMILYMPLVIAEPDMENSSWNCASMALPVA